MKKSRKIYTTIALLCGIGLSSCNKFLDEMPDNRAKLDNETKIDKLLVSAYPEIAYLVSAELSSDNVDDYGATNPNSERFMEELFRWKDITDVKDEVPKGVWEAGYKAIASANASLKAIEEMGNPESLNPQRGEALAVRAYNHFILVNMFAQHYTKENAATDLGITYMTEPEVVLDPKYQRNTVKEVYDRIVSDLDQAIPLIDDSSFGSTPKYHMNTRAANALRARVALYMQDWQKAVSAANAAIGVNPANLQRNYARIANDAVGSRGFPNGAISYNKSEEKANLMVATAGTEHGVIFGPYTYGSRYSHGALLSGTETAMANGPYGKLSAVDYVLRAFVYAGTNLDKVLFPRVSYMFEYTDPVAGIGYARGAYAPFTTEETMLVRAEALIHLKRYDEAIVDMKRWIDNALVNPPATFTVATVNNWANGIDYSSARQPTAKKKLDPKMIPFEAGTQENMLHAVLFLRRVETLHMGLRWFDIKRYGIEVERRILNSSGAVSTVETETKLVARDKRAALQIPTEVIAAGLTPNPR
ncbi:RagB/SusD family nutrient uptake outer membrane protein [Sphingobacterium thalpophilum]|uniref:RagB/SusD family nutrient uptake outer membrane protein n=1 Tax=Sphingobacterium thalpophilum TaxID=259 RepID=UPI003C72F243